MSRVRRNHIRRSQYEEPAAETEQTDIEQSAEDQEFAARIEARKVRNRKLSVRRKRRRVAVMVLIFAVLITMCSREIVRLKAENRALKKQQAQLEEKRDRLNRELGQVGDKEYIKDQARKQLRLLDPGEKMFIFEEDGNTDTTTEEDTE